MKQTMLILVLLAAACGSKDDEGTPDAATPIVGDGRYMPVSTGTSWTYRVEDLGNGTTGEKTQTVEALEDVGGAKAGVMAYRMRSDRPSGGYTISWQEDTGTAIVRHREQSFDAAGMQKTEEIYTPSKLRIDESEERLAMGTMYMDTYTEDVTDIRTGVMTSVEKTEEWTVVDDQVVVTVPAGTFTCIQLRRFNALTAADKTYWFARGVGKVREAGLGQIEELVSFAIMP